MAKAKAVNYSEEQISVLREMYKGEDNAAELKAISERVGKPVASVRSKLAVMGLYVAAEKAEKAGPREGKMDLVEKIGAVVGLDEHEKEGLYKATKGALLKVLAKLV
jgi:hypothetical protein